MSRSDGASPRDPADVGARAILRPAFARLLELGARVASDADASTLHALRVSLRRMRSVVRELEELLPEPERGALEEELRALARRTGPVRDLDVLLRDLDGHAAALPEAFRPALAPLRASLEAERARALRTLCRELTPGRLRALEATFERLERAEPRAKEPPTLDALVRARVARLARRIRRRGREAAKSGDPEALHALRKDVKRLRYVIDVFSASFARRDAKALVRDLVALQDALGALQDRVTQRALLERVVVAPVDGARPATYVAAGMLLERLDAGAREAVRAIPEALHRFDRRKAKAHVRRATRPSR